MQGPLPPRREHVFPDVLLFPGWADFRYTQGTQGLGPTMLSGARETFYFPFKIGRKNGYNSDDYVVMTPA